MYYENIDENEVCCLNCKFWMINTQWHGPADGVICEKDSRHTAPDDTCNLFIQDPIIHECLSGGGYSMDGGIFGQENRRNEKLEFYRIWLNK